MKDRLGKSLSRFDSTILFQRTRVALAVKNA